MCYIITDGTRYISNLGGIHSVYTLEEATKFEAWKAANVFKAIPNYLKEYGLEIKPIKSDSKPHDANTKQNRHIEKFFKSWNELNNNMMAYQCVANGIEYKGIYDPQVQKYWKGLKLHEKKIVFDKYGVNSEIELFELLDVN